LAKGDAVTVIRVTRTVINFVQFGYGGFIIGCQFTVDLGLSGERHDGDAQRMLAAGELLSQSGGQARGKIDLFLEPVAARQFRITRTNTRNLPGTADGA